MNKHIINVLQKYDFSFDKRNGYGYIKGYEVNVVNPPATNGPFFYFSTNLPTDKKMLFVAKMKAYKISLLVPGYFEFGVFVMIGAMTSRSFEKKFDDVLNKVLETLDALEAPKKEICPSTGVELTPDNSKKVSVGDQGVMVTLTNEAIESFNSLVNQVNEEYTKAPNNYFKGFCGILLGAIAGVIATLIFYEIGVVSALSSILSIFLGIFLYKKFGGKPNGVMIAMSLVTTIVFILGFILYIYVNFSVALAAENGLNYTGIEALKYAMNTYEEVANGFRQDMLMNVVFWAIAAGVSIFALVKSIKRPQNIK